MTSLPLQTRQTLKLLGFSDHESNVLQCLFHHQRLTTEELSRETTLTFATVHYTLHALETKQLIRRHREGDEDVVAICSDEAFMAWIDEQQKKSRQVYDNAKATLQMYLTSVRESSWKPNVLYFEGRQGILDIYQDMLAHGQTIQGWTDIQKIQETLGDAMEQFIQERIAKNIVSYAILPRNPVNEAYAQKSQLRHVKFSAHLPIDGEIRIYADKVAVITFHESKPVGFVFRGPVITSVFRAIFAHAWQSS